MGEIQIDVWSSCQLCAVIDGRGRRGSWLKGKTGPLVCHDCGRSCRKYHWQTVQVNPKQTNTLETGFESSFLTVVLITDLLFPCECTMDISRFLCPSTQMRIERQRWGVQSVIIWEGLACLNMFIMKINDKVKIFFLWLKSDVYVDVTTQRGHQGKRTLNIFNF